MKTRFHHLSFTEAYIFLGYNGLRGTLQRAFVIEAPHLVFGKVGPAYIDTKS